MVIPWRIEETDDRLGEHDAVSSESWTRFCPHARIQPPTQPASHPPIRPKHPSTHPPTVWNQLALLFLFSGSMFFHPVCVCVCFSQSPCLVCLEPVRSVFVFVLRINVFPSSQCFFFSQSPCLVCLEPVSSVFFLFS